MAAEKKIATLLTELETAVAAVQSAEAKVAKAEEAAATARSERDAAVAEATSLQNEVQERVSSLLPNARVRQR